MPKQASQTNTQSPLQQFIDSPETDPRIMGLFLSAIVTTRAFRLQFIMPEALLMGLLQDKNQGFITCANLLGVDTDAMIKELVSWLLKIEHVPDHIDYDPTESADTIKVFEHVMKKNGKKGIGAIRPVHFLEAMMNLENSKVAKLMNKYMEPLKQIALTGNLETWTKKQDKSGVDYEPNLALPHIKGLETKISQPDLRQCFADIANRSKNIKEEDFGPSDDDFDPYFDGRDDYYDDDAPFGEPGSACYRIDDNPELSQADTFEGREKEIDRSIVTLLKYNKGNIVYVGEKGVGKSAMVRGLIKAKGRHLSNSRFGGAHFYKINPSAIVTGVSYADQIEKHVAEIIDEIEAEDCMAVIFADNMAELMPQTQNDNTPDILRLITSLTEGSDIHLITTASFEQYKRLTTFNQSVERNFTRIDITEPPLDPDGRKMVKAGAKKILNVHSETDCPSETIDKIIDTAATSYSKDIAMPGRAIDLLDSVCAFAEKQRSIKRSRHPQKLDATYVDELLKMLGYDSIASSEGKDEKLRTLEPDILKKIYGQDEAVHCVAESVLLAKAGLSDDTKPLAAYLFVGPTGVGKTELAKVLANELGTKLVRFDMSEYSEQHTVSKLVGSPAGYVGYDDGGLLTDSVRKNPNCVLLFDEIEKAHTAVFNILLQVLDYAQLTDNKGQKADFSGAIIIMTSNAGARFATGRGLGYGSNKEKSEVMGSELKRVFAPEFLNRLTQIVSFHDMTEPMAERVLDRKVAELQEVLLKKRKVSFTLTPEARETLIKSGFSTSYGAREMDRAIGRLLKPALMQALLFDKKVADGANLVVSKETDDKFVAKAEK